MFWQCSHTEDQVGGKRCINCSTARGLNYVLRRAAGGSPAAWRYLCEPCERYYSDLGLIDELGTAMGGGRVREQLRRLGKTA